MSGMTLPSPRLDKWLWHARFFKTRALAQRTCESGKIRVNSVRVYKAHHGVKPGDVLTFPQGGRIRVVRVRDFAEQRGPAREAQKLYDNVALED